MDLAGRIAETLARRTGRREPLKALSAGIFGLAAITAAQGPVMAGRFAKRCTHISPYEGCNPPHGRYCTDPDEDGVKKNCDGATCANNCTLDAQYYPGSPHAACWCTAITGSGSDRSYYKCCDCQCPDLIPRKTDEDGANPQGCGCRKRVFLNRDAHSNDTSKHRRKHKHR